MNSSLTRDFLDGSLFRGNNASLSLPDFRWENYEEIVQPDKVSFWVIIGSLLLFIVWNLFIAFYLSRVFGPIVAFLLTRIARLKGYNGHITIDSFSISLLAGKIMFRNMRYTCCDYSVHCNDGWIIFSYWRYVSAQPIPNSKDSSRLHITVNGLQVHFYNRLTCYRSLAKYFSLDRLFSSVRDEAGSAVYKKLSRKDELAWESYYDRLWKLFGILRVDVGSGRIVAGNSLLPSMLVVTFDNYTSKVSLKESPPGSSDRALLDVGAHAENVRVALVKCAQFEQHPPSHFTGRRDSPPRTMGDGFAVLQTAHLDFYYVQSLLGVVKGDSQSTTIDQPVWESVWRFGNNTVLSYGPWADSQRVLLYNYFFPPEQRINEVTVLPKRGERRIYLAHDARLLLLNDSGIDVWFMRGDELNALHLRVKQGSSVHFKLPWIVEESGYTCSLRCSLLCVESSTSLSYRNFFQCETLCVTLDSHFPRIFNALQTWKYSVEIDKISAWLVWDHKRFFTDLVEEWSSDLLSDFYSFVPYTWEFDVRVFNNFELILALNDKNWIDSSSTTAAENILAAVLGKEARIRFAFPFVDFCPETVSTTYEISANGSLALRMWLPTQSSLSPVLHSIQKCSRLWDSTSTSYGFSSVSDLAQGWVEMWRTESVSLLFVYTYHPAYANSTSDLPGAVVAPFCTRASAVPFSLNPDELSIEIEIGVSEVILTGLIIRLIVDLKNNYFGLYDQLSDVNSADATQQRGRFFDEVINNVEYYRPLSLRFCLRVNAIKGTGIVHGDEENSILPAKCCTVLADQVVVEIMKGPFETLVQVNLGSALASFESKIEGIPDGALSLKTLSFRGHALFSDLDVPWDAASIEYGWLMEIIIGSVTGTLHPFQVVVLAELLESILLLAFCPDEDLMVPEKYDVCHHGNGIRTCPRSSLNLMDSKGRVQNCEYEENLKYKMLRVSVDRVCVVVMDESCAMEIAVQPTRIACCNSHEGSFCSSLLLKFPSISVKELARICVGEGDGEWAECAQLDIQRVAVDIRLPYSYKEVHLLQERKAFLMKHDKATSRLYFLWHEGNGCACSGKTKFFGAVDTIGGGFLQDMDSVLAVERLFEDPLVQPGIGQSIVYSCKRALSTVKMPDFIRKSNSADVGDVGSFEELNVARDFTRKQSEESFHSAVSTSLVNMSHDMECPIFSSSILVKSYATFLHSYEVVEEDLPWKDDINPHMRILSFNKTEIGLNDLNLVREEVKPKSTPAPLSSSVERLVKGTPVADSLTNISYGSDCCSLYVRGSSASRVKLFITPLALEVTQQLAHKVATACASVHPAFVAQHLYASCAFRHHSQPLTNSSNSEKHGHKTPIYVTLNVPTVDIALFQCGLIEKIVQSSSLRDPGSNLVRSSVALFVLHESPFTVATKQVTGDELKHQVTYERVNFHGQFLQVVESGRKDFTYNRTVPLSYTTNWTTTKFGKPLSGFDLRVVCDLDIPDVSFRVNQGSTNSPQRSSSGASFVELLLGSSQLSFGLCKPLDQTSRNEWPLFDVYAPCLTAWTYAAYRLSESLSVSFSSVEQHTDLAFAKLLSEALDSDNEKIVAREKSCYGELKCSHRAAASCASCKLALILLRYSAVSDVSIYRESSECANLELFADRSTRKQALVALLSHWQTIICSQIKLADAETANRYVKIVTRSPGEVYINVDALDVDSCDPRKIARENSKNSRPGTEWRQMDLYHWMSARHREHKEATSKGKSSKKTLDDFCHINPMEITLSVFFWSVYEQRNLEPSAFGGLPFPLVNAAYSLDWSEIKIDVLEPKLILSSALNYYSVTRHRLLHIESFHAKGHLHSRQFMDDFKLKPIRAVIDTSFSSNAQSVRLSFALASVCVFNDLSRVARATANAVVRLRCTESSCRQRTGSPSVSADPALASLPSALAWIHGVVDKLRDYKGSRAGNVLAPSGCLQLKAEGHFNFRVVMLEMALTHLFVSMTFKKIEISHKNQRDTLKAERQTLDELNASMQRANLILSEFVIGLDAKHIVNFSLKTSSFRFRREQEVDRSLHNYLNLLIGDIEGDMPIHAQNLHEVVLRNASQLNEQMTRLEYNEPAPVGEYSPHLQCRQSVGVVHFEISISSVELTAQLLPSLKAKYRLSEAKSSGKTGAAAKFMAKIKSHVVNFTVIASSEDRRACSLSSDTFTLALPHIYADGEYRPGTENTGESIHNENLQFREGGYIDIELIIGKLEHSFTTDLLNQVLFAEQCFRSELSLLIDRIAGDRPSRPAAPLGQPTPTQYPFLFSLSVRGEAAPWLQLTASTPTSTAVRLTFDNISATLTNRWAQKDNQEKTERLYGKAAIGVSAKLGQLVKNALFEEIETELQEFATFMTQISIQNKDSTVHSSYSYVITVNRPIFLIKSSAIDKAILLWINYKNTYDYWREERSKMLKSTRHASITANTPSISETEVDLNLSLKVTNGVYVCMPLYSAELSANMSALVVSLQSTDITVCVRRELACQATFHNFKVKFIDNFDDQALSDSWLEEESSDASSSNYFFFPQGTYQFVSRATAASCPTENAKWTLSVKWQMLGMIIDIDHRIGKLTSLLLSTFSSLALGDTDEVWEESARESTVFDSNGEEERFSGDEQDAEIDATGEFGSLAQPEERVQWLERKMHEQSVLVTDLMQCKASEPAIEKERRKLRKLELARFKQFRKSMLDKLKRNAVRHKKRTLEPKKIEERSGGRQAVDHVPWERAQRTTRSRSPSLGSAVMQRAHILQQQYSSSSRLSEGNAPGTAVDMDIDVQVSIECGQCTLRGTEKQEETPGQFSKRPSARDLKAKAIVGNGGFAHTKLAIPSVDAKAHYASIDPQVIPRHVQAAFPLKFAKQSFWRRPVFYLSVALSSMPEESLVTPHLADFLEQMLEPLPEASVFNSSVNLPATIDDSGVPIVEMDTSSLALDVIFYLTVQSITIRFEGHQQRSAAADCLLKLPSLTLMASTRPLSDIVESNDSDAAGGGIHLSATLNAFSLNIYSPHQQSTSHDALSLTLDHLSLLVSRSKNSRTEPDNKVQFVLTTNVGSANFNYDMRRLAELISFPKPWYRRTIIRRLFFGDHSVKAPPDRLHSSSSISKLSPKPATAPPSCTWEGARKKDWSATVIFAAEWKELNINAQMANTMGSTKVFIRDGVLRGHCLLNSKLERDINVNFRLKSSVLSAHGGAISGEISIADLHLSCTQQIAFLKPPVNSARIELEGIESRIEWMSRSIFIGRFTKPSVSFTDEWLIENDDKEEVMRASVSVNLFGSWEDLQMVITKVTVDEVVKIALKLHSFFQEQLTNSRMMWGIKSPQDPAAGDFAESKESDRLSTSECSKYMHWPRVLDALTELQTGRRVFPIPTAHNGVTTVGGTLELNAVSTSLACMHGEMNANSWALFHMRRPSILFTPEAQYTFVTPQNDVGVSVVQRLTIRLGDISSCQRTAGSTECMAVVCRVQQSRGSMLRQTSSISACLEHIVGDVLKQLDLHPFSPCPPTAHHSVLQLFQFPALDAVLSTLQQQEIDVGDEQILPPEVRSSFICEFHDIVSVQTDFNAQVGFLPELIKSYMSGKDPTKEEKNASASGDFRQYVCETWNVDPKIRFIDRFKWNPPVIDEILRKLQIFDHRRTIPKALQRGLLDPCDALLAQIHYAIVCLATKASASQGKQ